MSGSGGATGEKVSAGGCGCNTPGSAPLGSGVWLVAGLIAVSRRSARRRGRS
jgi:hypothetical protein